MMKECIYALDAGGTFLKCGLFTPDGKLLPGSVDSEHADSNSGTPDEIRAAYAAIAARAAARAAAAGYRIIAAGMDTPGPFDYPGGIFRMKHKYAALYGVSVRPWFAADFGDIPLTIIHDSAAFILGAAGDVPGLRRISGVMLGTGLGFALMEDGEVLYRADGGPRVSIYASPFHGTTAEELISARGIVSRYNAVSASDTTGKGAAPAADALEVAQRAGRGDAAAALTYAETGGLLAELIAPILAEHRTEALILGGQISRDFALFGRELRAGLSGVATLSYIAPAAGTDTVHLRGCAAAAGAKLR